LKLAVLFGIMLFFVSPAFGLNIVTREIKFDDDPVEIITTITKLEEGEFGKELYCFIKYTNPSNKDIDALSFRMLFYDVFNEHLDTISEISIDKLPPGKIKPSRWKSMAVYKDWSTHTVVIFLDRVRFADGTIWRRPEIDITQKLGKLTDILFKPEQLEEKRLKKERLELVKKITEIAKRVDAINREVEELGEKFEELGEKRK